MTNWTHVGDGNNTGTGSTLAVSYSSAGGTALVVLAAGYVTGSGSGLATLSSVTDSAGNTWTVVNGGGGAGSSYTGQAVAAYCLDAAAVTSVTLHWSTAPDDAGYAQVSEFSGVPAGATLDTCLAISPALSGVTTYETPPVKTTGASDLVLAVTAVGAGWTSVSPGTDGPSGAVQWSWTTASAGSQQFTFTESGGGQSVQGVLVLALGAPAAGVRVVQAVGIADADTGSLAVDATAGNTVFLAAHTGSGSNVTISSSSPTLGGSSVTGAAKLLEVQSAYGAYADFGGGDGTAYAVLWMLPDVAGSEDSIALTVTNGTLSTSSGLQVLEVAGLGASPALDQSSTGTGISSSPSSGTTGAITSASEIVVGLAKSYVSVLTDAGSPWLESWYGHPDGILGYQVPSSSGGTYSYSPSADASAPWAAGVATVYAPATFLAPPSRPRGQAVNRASTY